MSHYATHVIDTSTVPDTALTVQQIITAALLRIATGTITPFDGDLDLSGGVGGGGSSAWGDLSGTITDQTDLVDYVAARIAELVDSSPTALDTLNELAAALGDDANFATTVNTALAARALQTITLSAGSHLEGGGDLSANRSFNLSSSNRSKLDELAIAGGRLKAGLPLATDKYDHTIEDGEPDAPPLDSLFQSTVNSRWYHRLPDGSTELLNNLESEYGGTGHTHDNKTILDAITAAFTIADKAKLDQIEAQATADQTGSEIVTAINTQLGGTDWQTGGQAARAYVSGKVYWGSTHTGNSSSLLLSARRLYFYPLYLRASHLWSEALVFVQTTGTAGHDPRIGLYADAGDVPGELVSDWGRPNCTLAGERAVTVNETISAGLYWLCLAAYDSGSGPRLSGITGAILHGPEVGVFGAGQIGLGYLYYTDSLTGASCRAQAGLPLDVSGTSWAAFSHLVARPMIGLLS
ncbi:MAG: hypothetical protein KDA91_14300 [Planctomycetaceae bacterium]|nr:hypothetical protein [Planctomycetaceae bacterium]